MVFKHKDPCTTLTQAEYIAACGDGHIFACQATGDILYASSATVLSKLAKGNQHEILSMGGSNIPAWTASPSVTDLTISGGCITLSAATDIDLLDDNASALSFDATGKAGIIDIVTTDCSEGVTMSGTLGVTGALTATAGITVGSDGSGADVTFHSATGSDNFLWDASCEKLVITGTNAQTALCIADGNVVIADTLYFFDAGGEYISSNGSVLAITGATTVSSTLGVTGAITANAGVVVDCLTIDACAVTAGAAFTIDATTDIVLDADGDNITFKAGSGDSTGLDFSNASGTWTVKAGTSDSDLIFNVNDGGVDTKVMTIDGGDSVVTFGGNCVKSGEIRILEDTTCGVLYTAIKVGNMAANVTYTLPTNYAGCNGMALTSTTGGVMSWASAGGGTCVAGTTDNGILTFVNSGSTFAAEANLTFDGTNLTVGTGNVIIGTAGKGIDFAAQTQSTVYTASAEILNHYEEGVWTPVVWDDCLTNRSVESVQVGTYTRIGRSVHIQAYVSVSSLTGLNAAEQMRVGGLPFTSANVANRENVGIADLRLGNITAGEVVLLNVNPNAAYGSGRIFDEAAGTSGFTLCELSANGHFIFSASYVV